MDNEIKISTIEADDVENIVEIHLKSFPGFFLTFMGKKFLKVYYQQVALNSSGIIYVCWLRGKQVGFIAGFMNPSAFYKYLLKKHWFRFGLASIPSVIKNPTIILRLLRAFNKPKTSRKEVNDIELTSFAVLPFYQKRGIGKKLFSAFVRGCLDQGVKNIYLTTDSTDNVIVNSLYERVGFKLIKTFETHEKRRMNEYRLHL